jgi:metal-responsive CopG/Arc/MetJ family transcriptional regulator
MPARSVQISIDEDLLREIDRQAETKDHGRSAFMRNAARLYLDVQRRRSTDREYAAGYGGKADEVWDEFSDLISRQAWPAM